MKKLLFLMLVILGAVVVTDKLTNDKYIQNDRFVKPSEEGIRKTVVISVFGEIDGEPVRVGGSGVFISKNGHILTCAHLFTNGPVKTVLVERSNGDVQRAEGLAIDVFKDLALIKVTGDKDISVARIADPRSLKVGQEVIAIGSPLGLDFTVTTGIISALNRDFGLRYNVTQSVVHCSICMEKWLGLTVSWLDCLRFLFFRGLDSLRLAPKSLNS
jgi:S1-C subfamily serine protease